MVIAVLTLECHLAVARSLKDKRMVLRSLKDRLRRFNVSVAETKNQDLWQRAELVAVTVAATADAARRELEAVAAAIEQAEPGLITRSEVELL